MSIREHSCVFKNNRIQALYTFVLLISIALILTACQGGVTTEAQPNTSTNSVVAAYTGPVAATSDVQAFKTNLWDNIQANNRCGGCHGGGDQSPEFVHQGDVNIAYGAALSLVNLTSPADSRLATKVSGGHNCWLDSDSACGAVMAAYIESWATGSGLLATKQIQLTAPVIKDPGASKNYPDDDGVLFDTVITSPDSLHDLLIQRCSGCHVESAPIPQAPFFANSDSAIAYDAVRSKINLDTPAISRLVVRLRNEFHNCWSDCQANAQEMEDRITDFTDNISITQVHASLIVSKALKLTDGIIASGGNRHEANQIALFEFKTGTGNIVYDTSGVEPALNLTLSGTEDVDYKWVGGWGVELLGGKAQGSTAASKKVHDLIKNNGEYTIEAWAVPANVTQEGPARIVSYSGGVNARNFTLGQTLYNYDFLNRSSTTDANGEPALSTADADEDLQATQQHVVVTYDPVNGRRLYVNGVFTDDLDSEVAGNLNDWDDSFAFVLGNEVSGGRPWNGKLRLVAMHNRALTQEQITKNFEVGVGEKFFLLFSIADEINISNSYIMFEVSQFDNYSYLLNTPTFINLDSDVTLGTIPVKGMRIGVNGKEAAVGQAYLNMDTNISDNAYGTEGQVLSQLGTIIALEKGADDDEFFLTFEELGSNTNVVVDTTCVPLSKCIVAPAIGDPASDIGVRTFEEISAAMSSITGVVPVDHTDVKNTFDTIKQQLPTVERIEGYLPAHQTAVAQLAIEYCNALVEDATLRSAFFPVFDFTQGHTTAFDNGTKLGNITDPLIDKVMGTGLSTQPLKTDISTELNNMIDILDNTCTTDCGTTRTHTIVKAACAATLASAVMIIQ